MSPRLQAGLLVATMAAVGAFVVSFAAGLRDPGPGEPEPEPAALLERIRVEVLNGAGRPGLARQATDRLVEQGFDVVFFGNAGRFGRDSSVVIDRRGDGARAHQVASALGIVHVETSPDPDLHLDATVILGADWPPPPPRPPDWRDRAGSVWDRARAALGLGGGEPSHGDDEGNRR